MKRLPLVALLMLIAFSFGLTSMKAAEITGAIIASYVAPILVKVEILPAEADIHCLALNIYFETRNQPVRGKIGVGHVVLNRVADKHYPNDICAVVKQGVKRKNHIVRNKCQFSWYCDGKDDKPKNTVAWSMAQVIAKAILKKEFDDPTNGSLMYHADYVKPYWRYDYKREVKLGTHIFYTRG